MLSDLQIKALNRLSSDMTLLAEEDLAAQDAQYFAQGHLIDFTNEINREKLTSFNRMGLQSSIRFSLLPKIERMTDKEAAEVLSRVMN